MEATSPQGMLGKFGLRVHFQYVQEDHRQDSTNDNQIIRLRFDCVNCDNYWNYILFMRRRQIGKDINKKAHLSLPVSRESIPSPIINIINSPYL
jgi:hypothetical protein